MPPDDFGRPLVYALGALPEAAAAGVIAMYGVGWILLGARLMRAVPVSA